MKKITFISVAIVICLACNNGTENEPTNTNMNDSNIDSKAAEPTPGLGQDPTRNDPRQGDPLGQSAIADSTTQKGEAEPTPGLGNDPTRNDPNNTLSPPNENAGKKDTGRKRN